MRAYPNKEKAGVVQPALSSSPLRKSRGQPCGWIWEESVGCCDSPWPTASGGNRENPRPSPPVLLKNPRTLARVLYRKMQGSVLGWSLADQPLPHNGGMPIREDHASTSARASWKSFLHRPPLLLDRAMVEPWLAGKRVLLTGAGGCGGR